MVGLDGAGSLADWIGAVETAGALVAAVVLLARDHRQRARQQAECVATWIDYVDDEAHLYVRNESDAAMYEVDVPTRAERGGIQAENGLIAIVAVGTVGPRSTSTLARSTASGQITST